MTLMIWALVVGGALELLLHVLPRPLKIITIYTSCAATIFGSVSLVVHDFNGCTALILLLSLYRLLNFARILIERLQPNFLKIASLRASIYLINAQLLIGGIYYIITKYGISSSLLWYIFAGILCVGAVSVLLSVIRTLVKTKLTLPKHHYTDSELPSITVAIPARNETDILESNLRAIVASDYPKLEVIVLDDCSQNKRTPEIIRQFAQDGVRFLAGTPPADNWLAKNQAYQQLLTEASGKYIVFMGVDVAIEPNSLRLLIGAVLAKNKTMLSLLPLRSLHSGSRFSITQPMRYFWELAPPRRFFNRPPVLSSCWVIARDKVTKYGGFKAVSNAIVPEAYFAKKAIQDNDSYSFMLSSNELGIRSVKPADAQHSTALRTRYPQLHRRLELVALLGLFEAVTLLGPLFVLLCAALGATLPFAVIVAAGVSALLLSVSMALIASYTRINPPSFGAFAFPLIVLNDLWMLHYSLYKYEFSTVEWKGRNVCIPVMQVIPHLPKID